MKDTALSDIYGNESSVMAKRQQGGEKMKERRSWHHENHPECT